MNVKRTFVFLALSLLLGALFLAVLYSITLEPRISVDYAALHDEMRKPANYDPNKDGADLCHKAARLLENAGEIRLASKGRSSSPLDVVLTNDWPGDLSPVELASLKAWFQANAEGMALLEEALAKDQFWQRCQQYGVPLWRVILYDLNGMADGHRGLVWRGKMKAAEGRVQEGLDDIFAAGNTGRCFGEKPTTVERLVQSACATSCYGALTVALAKTTLNDKELADIASRVEAMARYELKLGEALVFEQFLAADRAQRIFSDNGKGDGTLLMRAVYEDATSHNGLIRPPRQYSPYSKVAGIKKTLQLKWRSPSRKEALENYQRVLQVWQKLSETPPYRPEYAAYNTECQALADKDVLGLADGVRIAETVTLTHRYANAREGLLTLIAILRYKAANGRLPAELAAVVDAGYLKELAIDRFSGQPFVYRVIDGGFTLYSVGENGTDDGGTRTDKLDDVYWPVDTEAPPKPAK